MVVRRQVAMAPYEACPTVADGSAGNDPALRSHGSLTNRSLLQVKRRIASRMLKIWNISLTKSEVLAHIEQRTFVEFNIELVSNEALAAQSARFLEERLGVPVDAAGSGPSGR